MSYIVVIIAVALLFGSLNLFEKMVKEAELINELALSELEEGGVNNG